MDSQTTTPAQQFMPRTDSPTPDLAVATRGLSKSYGSRVALTGLVRARWSDAILDEWERSVLRLRSDVDPAALRRTRELIIAAVPDSVVGDFAALIPGIDLPDPDDRHVLAAAVRAGAQAIVTFNLKDFPETSSRRTESRRCIPTSSFSTCSTSAPASSTKRSSAKRRR